MYKFGLECLSNKMKKKIYHTLGTVPKFKIKITERYKIDIPNRHIHDSSLSRHFCK
jgi:hypothetical protein